MASSLIPRQRQGLAGMLVGGGDSVVKGRGLQEEGTGQEIRGPDVYSLARSDGHGQAVHSLYLSSLTGTGRSLDQRETG